MRNRYSGLLAIVLTSSICANAQSIDGKVMENDSIPVPPMPPCPYFRPPTQLMLLA